MLKLENISSGYHLKQVIKNINLSVRQGEMVAVFGKTGSGKSTLLKTMAGQLMPISGRVFLDYLPMTEYSFKEIQRKISFLQEFHSVSSISVYDMISCGRLPYRKFCQSLSNTDIYEINNAMRLMGIDNMQSKKMNTLSRGQQQLVYFASIVAQQADILLLDEPTAFLDAPYKEKLIGIIKLLHSLGKTIVIASQDIETYSGMCSHTIILQDGKIHADSPSECITQGYLREVYNTPSKNPQKLFM